MTRPALKRKKRPPDRCAQYCGQVLAGIVENLKRTQNISDGFEVEIKPARGVTWVPADSYVMKCPMHGKSFVVREKK